MDTPTFEDKIVVVLSQQGGVYVGLYGNSNTTNIVLINAVKL